MIILSFSFFFSIKVLLGSWGVLFLNGIVDDAFFLIVFCSMPFKVSEVVCLKDEPKNAGLYVVFLLGVKKLLDG